ncbi:MAG: PA0069 family radical SAM protein [Rubrivivax sp.]|nr:MAG: PA0069 family radical SAM protein [Rubrivivax sp.]
MAVPLKGRGTATRLAHRFEALARESLDDGWAPLAGPEAHDPKSVTAPGNPELDEFAIEGVPVTSVVHEQARSILSRNDSPDIPFTWSVNPYRGCEHGCIYCYARPTHSYLNLSPGLDFETRLTAKVNAAELLRHALSRPRYEPSPLHIGGITDAYQPVERSLRLTRAILEVLDTCRHPFSIVTKSSGVERDLDLLVSAASRQQALVIISVTTLDAALSRRLEPRAASPQRRLQTVRRLAQAGVPVHVNVAPVIPFLNEPEIERIVEAAAEAGAQAVHYTVVRLPWEVSPLFQEWLDHHVPDKAARIMARIREMRGGRNYQADFGTRMKGQGVWADLIGQRVAKAVARAGLGPRSTQRALTIEGFDPRLLGVLPASQNVSSQGELF